MTRDRYSIHASSTQVRAASFSMIGVALALGIMSLVRFLDSADGSVVLRLLLTGLLSAAVFSRIAANLTLRSGVPVRVGMTRTER